MTNIIVVFPKLDDAKSIRNLLARNGFHVVGVCTTGTQVISRTDELNGGIVICGYKMADMLYSQLREYLPPGFEMLTLAPQQYLSECESHDIIYLSMPLKAQDLVSTLGMMIENRERRRKKERLQPRERNPEEKELLKEAKNILIERNHMTEEEAHRYLQKCSMDSGTNMVETAQMVLSMMKV